MANKTQYQKAIEIIHGYVTDASRKTVKYNLNNINALLGLLNNPQDSFKTIHVAGTSGKGSTTLMISSLLKSQGFKVGLTQSPHMLDIRERIIINGRLISKSKFAKYFFKIKPAIDQVNQSNKSSVSFFEAITALAFYTFREEKIDYGIIETGLGGTLDATNTIHRSDKISVITKIGLDHMNILGNTLAEIAAQKAGIINKSSICITYEQDNEASRVIRNRCSEQNTKLIYIKAPNNYSNTNVKEKSFDYEYGSLALKSIKLGLIGLHQMQNCALALTALDVVSQRDQFTINSPKTYRCLKNITFHGRFEKLTYKRNTIIVDGAHNPQKMQAFLTALKDNYLKEKFTFFLAFKQGKDYSGMLKRIIPLADRIYLSSFNLEGYDSKVSSENPDIIKTLIENLNMSSVKVVKSEEIPDIIIASKNKIVITGSLYFISDLYTNSELFRNILTNPKA